MPMLAKAIEKNSLELSGLFLAKNLVQTLVFAHQKIPWKLFFQIFKMTHYKFMF